MSGGVRYGLDTNVLIYAHLPVFGESEQVRGYLQRGLADDHCRFSLTALVLHEFVHIVTDARRFDPPVAMAEALAIARSYLNRTNIECLPVDEGSLRLALGLLDAHALGRRRIADTLLASTLLTHGVTTIVTCNPADFACFDGLAVVDPRRDVVPDR
ncbi:MAG: PIN domain-containing protein [Acidobacteria bacterium]|nr:PIN domain-containing protein [Acidobacteriota bacterium]